MITDQAHLAMVARPGLWEWLILLLVAAILFGGAAAIAVLIVSLRRNSKHRNHSKHEDE